jgi:hypothetical protein
MPAMPTLGKQLWQTPELGKQQGSANEAACDPVTRNYCAAICSN